MMNNLESIKRTLKEREDLKKRLMKAVEHIPLERQIHALTFRLSAEQLRELVEVLEGD